MDKDEIHRMDELAQIKRHLTSMQEGQNEILSLLKGTELHKGNGLIDRIITLEKNQRNGARIVGAVGGVGAIFGGLLMWLFKIFDK